MNTENKKRKLDINQDLRQSWKLSLQKKAWF